MATTLSCDLCGSPIGDAEGRYTIQFTRRARDLADTRFDTLDICDRRGRNYRLEGVVRRGARKEKPDA